MDESRLKSYLNLIQSLLDCKSGEELALLQNNQELIDIDFIQVMEQVATQAQEEGQQKAADFLQTLVKQLKKAFAVAELTDNSQEQGEITQTYYNLIEALLSCSNGQEGQILKDNFDLLDLGLSETMKQVAETLMEEGEEDTSEWLLNVASQVRVVVAARLFDKGNQYYHLNNFAAAEQSWQESLALYQEIGDRQWEAELLSSLGIAYYFMGRYQIAIDYCQQSLKIQKDIGARTGEADSLINIGNALYSSGKYDVAIDYYQQSLAIKREIGERRGEATALMNIGNALYSTAKYDLAIDYYQKSLAIQEEIGDRKEEAKSRGNLGAAYIALGQYKKAIDFYEQQLAIARQIEDRLGEANALNNLGTLYNALGQYESDIKYQKQSLAIYQEIKYRHGEACSLGNLSSAYRALGQYDLDIDYQQQSLAITRELGDLQGEATSLGSLGNTYLLLGEYDAAVDYYQQWLKTSQEIGDRTGEAKSMAGLGIAYYYLEKYQQAIDYHRNSLKIAEEIGDFDSQGTALNNLGYSLFKSDQIEEAETKLQEGIKIRESLRLDLKDSDKISIFEDQARTYRLLQEVLIYQNKFSEALEISERGRTRAFVDLLAERLFKQTNTQNLANPITYVQVQQVAQLQNSILVEYSIIDENKLLFIWVIKPTGEINFSQVDLKFLKQEYTSLSNLITQARTSLGILDSKSDISNHTVFEDCNKFIELKQLYKILIQPISHLLPTDPKIPVFFIPQDNLFLIPFPALQDAEGKFLIEKHTIVTAPSIQILELTQKRSVEVPETSLEALVVGNPKMPTIPLTEPPVELKNLAWAKTEAQAIAPFLNTQAITGADATKAYITQLLPKARLIHLATHGLLDDIRQLGIPGAIALSKSDEDNGFLTAGEIYDMKLNAELVVLSACSTGQGKITGDGVIGLSRCLIAAGVKSVIVSLWSVEDLSTALLMVKFYQIFQKGVAATVALNEAQRWLLGVTKTELSVWVNTNERFFDATLQINLRRRLHQLDDNAKLFHNPRYWAAFCAIGQ
ncbi:CHAT domain-containing protein [Calothrix sp. FACHB-156]|uniref:CHAT domain-containing tetratricopeptide repeat protein n=1 Tax=Nostocaceae TaxID=1162 RepID=UPI001684116D|nr:MULTISPECIES: CHAT domain-containing tetratricopeptide repeat protein [Nostocaceae]MBD2337429.1 CHAT domain-containing protein [Calothrix sp. FACHB-156]MBD2457075.1 CHAT domain-containing protein [Nostoc sp. FACHB-87]MBD2478261.1 CHAT domain-containing protein [Anabaena sp. FACHB-83]